MSHQGGSDTLVWGGGVHMGVYMGVHTGVYVWRFRPAVFQVCTENEYGGRGTTHDLRASDRDVGSSQDPRETSMRPEQRSDCARAAAGPQARGV